MKRRIMMTAAVAAAVSLMMAVPGQASDIGDFLTGGTGTQNTETTPADTNGGTSTDTTTATASDETAAQSMNMVTCTDDQTGINVARAVVPEGYNVTSETTWCGPCQSPDYPAEVFIKAESPDGSIQLTYESPLEFVQTLECNANGLELATHKDWTIDTDYLLMMLTYMNAQQYCDYTAQNCMSGASNVTFASEEPLAQDAQAVLQQLSQQKMDVLNQIYSSANGICVDYVETTAAERTYSYTDDTTGKQRYLIVSAATQGIRIVEEISNPAIGTVRIVKVLWTCPARYCVMCDADKYEEGKAVFEAFCSNTTISDQFKQAMADMSQKIVEIVQTARTGTVASQASTIQDSFSSELSGQDDSYSSVDAWDDAILDRNDYTLSSGDSVKVDTSYDYVYELPDGNVYATNSASDEPARSTRLYAN